MITWKVPFTYLQAEFDNELGDRIVADIREEVRHGRYTLGPAVQEFEDAAARAVNVQHVVGVNSGTDALIIALKAMGIGSGDEVISVPNTFYATIGAIIAVGARPVLVDVQVDYLLDLTRPMWIQQPIVTPRTKAVIPVDLTGNPVPCGTDIQGPHGSIPVLRDACQSIGAMLPMGTPAECARAAAFSLHPLKNVNVWGDGGFIATNDEDIAEFARLYRNHGLRDRDTAVMPGINSRLDTIQAIVGLHALARLDEVTRVRNEHAHWYDEGLRGLAGVTVPPRRVGVIHAHHIYVIEVERRAELQTYLAENGVETKIHYPVPVHLQPGYAGLGYKPGDFPNVERQATRILTLPIHEFLSAEQINHVIKCIRQFYGGW